MAKRINRFAMRWWKQSSRVFPSDESGCIRSLARPSAWGRMNRVYIREMSRTFRFFVSTIVRCSQQSQISWFEHANLVRWALATIGQPGAEQTALWGAHGSRGVEQDFMGFLVASNMVASLVKCQVHSIKAEALLSGFVSIPARSKQR